MNKEEFYLSRAAKMLNPADPHFFKRNRLRKIISLFRKQRGVKVQRFLDIACSEGSLTVILKKAMGAEEAYGVEISSEACEAARRKGVTVYQVDVDNAALPFEDGSFGAIYAGEIIEHLWDPDHLLDEVYRVLSPKGICLISTPNLASWYNRLLLFFGYEPYNISPSSRYNHLGKLLGRTSELSGGHIRVITLRAFKQLLSVHHFKVRRFVGYHLYPHLVLTRALLPAFYIDVLLSKFPSLASGVIAEIEKSS